jgi:hypothetical protein
MGTEKHRLVDFILYMERLGMDVPRLTGFTEIYMQREGVKMLKELWEKCTGKSDVVMKKLRLAERMMDNDTKPVDITYVKRNGMVERYTVAPFDIDNKTLYAVDTKAGDMKEFVLERITEIHDDESSK